MDFMYFNVFQSFNALVSLILLLQSKSTNAAHYIKRNHHISAVSSPGGNTSLPISARSQTECILKCRNKAGGEDLKPFYSNQNECFCLKDDQQEVDTLTKEKERITGSLLLMVSNSFHFLGIFFYKNFQFLKFIYTHTYKLKLANKFSERFINRKILLFYKIGNNGIPLNSPPPLTSQSNPGSSCKSIKEQFGNSASSGLYWIDLQPATQVYCDMDTDGGL